MNKYLNAAPSKLTWYVFHQSSRRIFYKIFPLYPNSASVLIKYNGTDGQTPTNSAPADGWVCISPLWIVCLLDALPRLEFPETKNRSDQGVMGGLVSLASFEKRFNYPSPGLLGFMVASYDVSPVSHIPRKFDADFVQVGCLLGAVLAFFFGDKLGRRWAIVYSCMVVCVGAALQASAYSRPHYISNIRSALCCFQVNKC